MLPAANRGAGMAMGFPDVCNTPAGPVTVPIPYPNMGMNAQATGFSVIVKVSMVNALNMGSIVPMTSGDEAGAAHPTIKGQQTYTMGSPLVYVDQLPAISLTSMTAHNMMNCPVGAVLVPSAVNVMYCRRNDGAGRGEAYDSPEPAAAPAGDELGRAPCLALELGRAMRARSIAERALWPGSIGYLRVPTCAPDLPTSFLEHARALEAAGARAVVVDLRGNPGGDLEAAAELAAALLPVGVVIVRFTERDGDEHAKLARGARSTLPLVLLVDRTTASAAELLAAALQCHRRALVVGEHTWGKGTAWQLDPEAGTPRALRRCRTPDGAALDAGVEPDLVVGRGEVATRSAWAAALHLVAEP